MLSGLTWKQPGSGIKFTACMRVIKEDFSFAELLLISFIVAMQLEVADRQLRSSRQFLEEHASERDQEVEDLIQAKEKLQAQLRERDATIAQHANLEKEVRNISFILL